MGKGRRDEIAAVSSSELKEQLVLKKQLGKGGFAAVFLGTYKGAEVAVKVLLPEHNVANGLHLKLMLREGQYMSRCTHRCIVKVHAVVQLPASFPGLEALGHRAATWALVMDYVPGGSIAQMLYKQMSQTHRAYSNYEAFCWVRDVAEALAYLHNAPTPVVHRDIKADNVLLTTDPDTGRPAAKLMDFGLMATMDGRSPLLRRRSINPQPQGGEGALGRASLGSVGSLARGSAGGAGGGAGSLAAPSVGTYYQDPTHEPSKIFYLVEELPASVVLALGSGLGPASRAASLDMRPSGTAGAAGGGGGAGAGRTSGDGGAAADGGPAPPSGAATPLASRTASAISGTPSGLAAAAAALAAGPAAPSTSPAGGGGMWGLGGKGMRGGGGPGPVAQPLGSLVPLNEEASYHGNTAGYASMLAFQQQQQRLARKQQQQQGGAPAGVGAGALAAGGLSGLFGRSSVEGAEGQQQQHRAGSMGAGALHLSLSHSALHSAASSGHGSTGGSGGGGNRAGLGQSHSLPCSLQNSSHGRAGTAVGNTPASETVEGDTVTPGAVRLRLSTEDGGPVAGAGAGGQGSALLVQQQLDKDGSMVQLSSAAMLAGEAAGVPSAATGSAPSSPRALLGGHQSANPPPATAPQPIAIAGSALAPDTTSTSNTAAASQPHQHQLHLSSTSSLAGSPAAPGSAVAYTHVHSSTASSHLPPGSTLHSRRASCDAVPPVEGGASPFATQGTPSVGGGGGSGGGHNANGSGVETLTGATGTAVTVSNASSSRPQSSSQRQVLVQATAALTAGGGGGSSTTRPPSGALDRPPPPLQPPAVERTPSNKSTGSSRSLTVPTAAGGGGGPSLAKPSISTVLQGAYERDFQWVWRLTGQTGSCMYMAPEVFRNLPYNEKVDVFSFGVLLYEVFSHTLTLTTATNMRELRLRGMDTPAGYAAYVADGYRPPRPNAMPEALYGLICACWHQDPLLRPAMADVAEQLQALQDELARDPPPPAYADAS